MPLAPDAERLASSGAAPAIAPSWTVLCSVVAPSAAPCREMGGAAAPATFVNPFVEAPTAYPAPLKTTSEAATAAMATQAGRRRARSEAKSGTGDGSAAASVLDAVVSVTP